jgi:hypothetical protein
MAANQNGRKKMAENGAFSKGKSATFPSLGPVLPTQAIDLEAFMSAAFFGAGEQKIVGRHF